MQTRNEHWELKIMDALPPAEELHSFAVGDVYDEGRNIMFTGGKGGLFWFTPDTLERGTIDAGFFHVGLAVEDIDGDGIKEVIAALQYENENKFKIVWYKPGRSLKDPWEKYEADPLCKGNPHDILFADIDNDGEREMLAVAAYTTTPGIFLYKHNGKVKEPWARYQIMDGHLTEGLAVGDLNGDGRLEIVAGADWYTCPEAGPYSGLWERKVFAPNFRDMCRVALVDITGNGRPDIVITESEYKEGQFSWFENRILEDPENPWQEHRIDDGLVFSHSLQAWNENGSTNVFLAEMAMGGWWQPYNYNARVLKYVTGDGGRTWRTVEIYKGMGTHQAMVMDIDGDGEMEVVGKTWQLPVLQIWKARKAAPHLASFRHSFIDRDKTMPAIDILAGDVDGDGLQDVICGRWWYRNPGWQKFEIPGIYQAVNVFDVDGDGRLEIIAIKHSGSESKDFYSGLGSEFVWLKPVDPLNNIWEEYSIGKGTGSWPHGTLAAKVLPEGRPAFIAAYHSGKEKGDFIELFEIPDDPKTVPWAKRPLAPLAYGEEMAACDVNRDGLTDIVTAKYLLINKGDGSFDVRELASGFEGARVAVFDVNRDGWPDIIAGEETLDFKNKASRFGKLVWFENPGNTGSEWKMHIIDTVRCPHSISAADIDGDGETEIICGEHDPFEPYRSRSRLFVYKKADAGGKSWYRYLIDDRFEHHNGAKVLEVEPGRLAIISHGWSDSQFVHIWELKP